MSDLSTTTQKLKFPSDPTQVSCVEPFVQKVARRFNLSEDVHGNMLVSLTEAVTNAIIHGNRNDLNKTVSISLRRQKDAVAIRVTDEGKGFDPKRLADPTSPESLECCGGRGVFLMKNLSDDCKFFRGGRGVEMRWKI